MIAHELAHVVNRDAAVMTVVGGPGEALLAGGVRVAGQGWYPLVFGGAIAALIGWIGTIGTRALSRYREYAADAGAVALTGNPAALASALMKVSEGLVAIPQRDLRAAAIGRRVPPAAGARGRGVPAAADAPAVAGTDRAVAAARSGSAQHAPLTAAGKEAGSVRAIEPSASMPAVIGAGLASAAWPPPASPS